MAGCRKGRVDEKRKKREKEELDEGRDRCASVEEVRER